MKKSYAFLAGLLASAAVPAGDASRASDAAVIRYTPYGVPHVSAPTLEAAAFGYGWALARDNLCVVVERAVTIAGQRSRSMAATGTYYDVFAGGDVRNVDSDAVYRYLLSPAVVERAKRDASADVRELVKGFVRGFNRHVDSVALPGETCRSQPWFRRLDENDTWRRIAHFPILETSSLWLNEIIAAAPPGTPTAASGAPTNTVARLAVLQAVGGGSNAAAFGRDAVEGRQGGMSFSNPHYFWHGTERLHAFHMTVPGKLNIFGSTAYGLPFALMGFNDRVGWSITHAEDKRSTIFELALDPRDPTTYLIGDKHERMEEVTVEVDTRDGKVKRTFWQTRYGPVIEGEKLPWDARRAYAFADPELANSRFADHFLAIARARDVAEIKDAQFRHVGSPWSNVTAADSSGNVYYSNISVGGNITDEQFARCMLTSPASIYTLTTDVATLNGSDPTCAWTRDPREPQPGIMPPQVRPWMIRTDMTFNSNDSHWLASVSPESRLEGFPDVLGPERTGRGERTRVAALYAQEIVRGSPLTGSPGASPAKWERLFFSARNLTAELILDDLLEDCRKNPTVRLDEGEPVDLAPACAVFRAWDRRDTLTSRGSALFAQFVSGLEVVHTTDLQLAARFWRVPFAVSDPIGTPRGFVPSDETRRALAQAVRTFREARVPIDAPLGEVQSVTRDGRRLPISGSYFGYHLTRASEFKPGLGVTELRNGDGYIHVVSLRPDGVSGRFLVTFSQSTNPSSPHYSDMTEVYSRESFVDVAFSEAAIRASQVGETVTLQTGTE